MAFFEWSQEYSVGLRAIDDQHKKIVDIMNELFDAIRYGKEEEAIRPVFVELLRYANGHFGKELELFERYHYVDEAKHVDEHNYFIGRVKSLMIQGYLSDRSVPLETLHFLKTWFTGHMLKTDVEYCRYFARQELMDEIEAFLSDGSAPSQLSAPGQAP